MSMKKIKPAMEGEWKTVREVGDCSMRVYAKCSNCGFVTHTIAAFFFNYCPNCGTCMVKEKDT